MSDKATEPPASAANTVELNRIDVHGSSLDDLVIQHVAMNAEKVGTATAPLMMGSNCAAAIKGIRKKPFLITFDVQSSGEVMPVRTDRTDTTATSAASTSSVTGVLVGSTARAAVRSAHALQHPITTT